MTVVETYAGGLNMDVADNPSRLHPKLVALISEGVAQNTTGNVFHPKDGGEVEISGSPTEKAILSWAYKLGMKFDTIRSESAIIHAFPFNSEKKRGGVAVLRGDSEVFIHWKGAAEIVLACCTQYMDSNGTLQPNMFCFPVYKNCPPISYYNKTKLLKKILRTLVGFYHWRRENKDF